MVSVWNVLLDIIINASGDLLGKWILRKYMYKNDVLIMSMINNTSH